MPYAQPPRRTIYRVRVRRMRVAGLLGVIAAVGAVLGYQLLASSSSTASWPSTIASHVGLTVRSDHGGLGQADGAVPKGTSVFDDSVPGVARLDPALLTAVRRAATDAGSLKFLVNSGWRSAAYEDQLRREAVKKYGSEAEAARWVATGSTSPHVSGDAVDIGPSAAADWLAAHGAAYGLCRIYANEPWHYELRPDAVTQGCPAMYADPTQDPRLQH